MRYATTLMGSLLIAALSPAAAQMYPGEDVTVNPGAAGSQVLLYPGGEYGRVVRPLLTPGAEPEQIQLHMPSRHHLARHAASIAAVAPMETAPVASEAPAAEAAPPPVRPAHVKHARVAQTQVAAPAAAQPSTAPVAGFSDFDITGPSISAKPAKPAAVKPEPPKRVAKLEPPPERTAPAAAKAPSGPPRDSILFAANASDPSSSAVGTVKSLASALNVTLVNADARVQLVAYGGERGVKSSDTRRLSLKRALVIRQLLIDDGVPSERIDVRAMGGVDDNGPADRVDVFVKS